MLLDLPIEIFREILGWLSIGNLCNLQLVNKQLRQIVLQCKSLKWIQIKTYNPGNDLFYKILKKFPNIKTLDLSNSPFVNDDLFQIFKMNTNGLQELLVKNCSSLREPGFYFPNLKILDLSNCKNLISFEVINEISLEVLSISETPRFMKTRNTAFPSLIKLDASIENPELYKDLSSSAQFVQHVLASSKYLKYLILKSFYPFQQPTFLENLVFPYQLHYVDFSHTEIKDGALEILPSLIRALKIEYCGELHSPNLLKFKYLEELCMRGSKSIQNVEISTVNLKFLATSSLSSFTIPTIQRIVTKTSTKQMILKLGY